MSEAATDLRAKDSFQFEPANAGVPFRIFLDDKGPFAKVLSQAFSDAGAEVADDPQGEDILLCNTALLPCDLHAEEILVRLASFDKTLLSLSTKKLVVISHFEVLGDREGLIVEGAPDTPAFPRQARLGKAAWNLSDERNALKSLVAEADLRVKSADRVSRRQEGRAEIRRTNKEPSRGLSFQAALENDECKERDVWLQKETLARASAWGFTTTRGYFCAILEQLAVELREDAAVVRLPPLAPATQNDVLVQQIRADHRGDGLIALYDVEHALLAGVQRLNLAPGDQVWLCPVDIAAQALCVALQATSKGKLAGVCHVVVEDIPTDTGVKPTSFSAHRLADLLDLAHRSPSLFLRSSRLTAAGLVPLSREILQRTREHVGLEQSKGFFKTAPKFLNSSLSQAAKTARSIPRVGAITGAIVDRGQKRFEERTVAYEPKRALPGGFTTDAVRIHARKLKRLGFDGRLHLRRYMLDVLVPTLQPLVREDVRVAHRKKPLAKYTTLLELIEELSQREKTRPALTLLKGNDVVTIRYRDLAPRAKAIASRLQEMNIEEGDRVLLSGPNHPDWALLAFGVAFAGAILIPVDPSLDDGALSAIIRKGKPKLALLNKEQQEKWAELLDKASLPIRDLHLFAASGPVESYKKVDVTSSQVASILFTSGTTGEPKGVMLSHANFTSLLSSLGTVFDMQGEDRSLSLLPLHHTLEYSCGLLLPLSAGAEIHYLDELSAERLVFGLKSAKITGMVGVPALWQLLERKIRKQVESQSTAVQEGFSLALAFNRKLGERTGKDLGRLLFKPVHDELGGHLRTLISGGAALPPEVHALFQGLGLHLAEGYGLTETAPVLTVAKGVPGVPSGTVGQPIPGVKLRILDENEHGVGEVAARAPNVMLGYFENPTATAQVMTEDGWFRTGDLGRINNQGDLVIVGRAKDVVVTAAGENIYLDDVEATLGPLPHVEEYTLLGVPDPRGGERLAMALYAEKGLRARAEKDLPKALFKVAEVYRPQVTVFFDEPLPRTATRKVKRKSVLPMVQAAQREREQQARTEDQTALVPVRSAIALVGTADVKTLFGGTDLRADLGFDSLMWVELQDALEIACQVSLDAEMLFECRSVAEVERLVSNNSGLERTPSTKSTAKATSDDEERFWNLPRPVKAPLRKALSFGQRELYQTLFSTEVEGRSHIPFNRPTIVVANHTSHLDTGLVKFALGRYGNDLAPLAAKDYFFEGNRLKVTLVENFTNLVPIERESGSGKAFEQAKDAVGLGKVVLIFPEGTRRAEGTLGEFKPLVGRLALACDVDILPLHLFGAFDALPRGASLPKKRELRVHIGPVLSVDELKRLTRGESAVEQARRSAALSHRAVAALRDGELFELSAFTNYESAMRIGIKDAATEKQRAHS
ncbi:MAG: AMP-binding protein [Deltaproteobacteria bacterium]|nr:AMP-binding protein [Deltaproteobacteria bacterium]